MRRVSTYENATVSITFPDDFQMTRIRNATATFLKRIAIEEQSNNGNRYTS